MSDCAHNPPVAGSNPAPLLVCAGERSGGFAFRASCVRSVNGFVNGGLLEPPSRSSWCRVPPPWIDVLHGRSFCATLLSMVDLSALPSTFTTAEARASGLHPRDLYASRDSGVIIELSRGVFRHADAPPASYPDLLAVARRVPRAIVCLLSAAAVHDLTDEIPAAVQVAVPGASRPPQISFPPTSVLRFEARTFELGLSSVEAAPGEFVRIYDPPRTVADLMRLRHRFGGCPGCAEPLPAPPGRSAC